MRSSGRYEVVINHEEQYSMLPLGQTIPAGWKRIGKNGSKKECLKYIEEVWTDMKEEDLRKLSRLPG